jgi:RimJ/RimL family protein N-acetyltransferase
MMRFADEYGFYELNPFPGSNQIVVSNHAFIYAQYRGKGIGQMQHSQRLAKAKELGYDTIICTVRADNAVEKHILKKNHWACTFSFRSTETGQDLEIWMRTLLRK